MHTRRRSFTVFLAIAVIAVANSLAPQTVFAGHHAPVSKLQSGTGHAAQEHGVYGDEAATVMTAMQGAATTNEDNAAGGPYKFCCPTMTCSASAVLTMAPVGMVEPVVARLVALLLDDMLWAFNVAAIDPPPRIG